MLLANHGQVTRRHPPTCLCYHTPMAKRPPPVPHNRGMRPLPNPSVGGWLGISGMSAKDLAKFGLNTAVGFAKAAGDPVGTAVNTIKSAPGVVKSLADTATRLDDYATLIQGNPGGKNDTRRLAAYAQVQGKGLQDLGNLALVLGAVKGATSPAGRQAAYDTRHALGQTDIVGQPIRSAILNAELKAMRNNPLLQRGRLVEGKTQVRNLYALRSMESQVYTDPVEYATNLQKISKSPRMVEVKLDDAKNPYYSLMNDPNYTKTIYEEIQSSGMQNFPPVHVIRVEGNTVLADGHHRIIAGNEINPKMQAKYNVGKKSFYSPELYGRPYITPVEKFQRTVLNTAARVADRRRMKQTKAYQQANNPGSVVFSSDLKAFLNQIKTPSSLKRYAEIEFDPMTNTKIVNIPSKSPKTKSSPKR